MNNYIIKTSSLTKNSVRVEKHMSPVEFKFIINLINLYHIHTFTLFTKYLSEFIKC